MCLSWKRKRQRLREWTCGYSGWGEGMAGWSGRVALTYVHHHVWDRQLDRSCWPARGAQLGALWWPRGLGWGLGGRSRREGVNVYRQPIHVFVQQKLTEYCKATYSSFFKKGIHLKKNIQSAIAHVDSYMMRPRKQCSNHQSLRRKMWEKIQWCELFGGSEGKASACNAGDLGSIPALGRSPGEGNGNPLQYFCLENSMDRGTW